MKSKSANVNYTLLLNTSAASRAERILSIVDRDHIRMVKDIKPLGKNRDTISFGKSYCFSDPHIDNGRLWRRKLISQRAGDSISRGIAIRIRITGNQGRICNS